MRHLLWLDYHGGMDVYLRHLHLKPASARLAVATGQSGPGFESQRHFLRHG